MKTLADCLKKAGKLISPTDATALQARAAKLQSLGVSAPAAARQAVQEQIKSLEGDLKSILEQTGVKEEPAPVEFAQVKPGPLSDDEMAKKIKPASALLSADEVINQAAKVPSIPKVDRKAALLAELQRARELGREGARTGNDTATTQGFARVKALRERLDDEFPGWEEQTQPQPGGESPKLESTRAQPGSNQPPPPAPPTAESAQPDDQEPSPFDPSAEPTMPVRSGKWAEVYGHSGYQPTALARTWSKARNLIVGIKGSVPELPTFPTDQTDDFTRAEGRSFYNRVREGLRALRSGNDYVQRTAEGQVAKIVTPLIKAGGQFSADDYAQLRRRQEQVRRLQADKKPVPAGVTAEITALSSKLETSPYVLFNRLALVLDLKWRADNLKDSKGNAIRLPAGVNAAELDAELQRLGEVIAASPHAALIQTALERHMAAVKQVAQDLKGRELLAAEQLENPFYFPHITLETTRAGKTEQRELRPERVRPGTEADFRGYLIDPVGSTKAIETDYVRALYFHLVQVGAHNLKADVVKNFFRPYDIMEKVRARAKELTAQRGRPVSWEQAFNEEFGPQGWVRYGGATSDFFPQITIDRDRLARRLGVMLTGADLQQQLKDLGLKGVKILPEDLQESLAMGAKETWIIPGRVAEALRGIAERETRQDTALAEAAKWTLGKWKAWKLFMPWNHIRYEYGNIVADLEKLFSADPRAFKYLAPSAKELREFWKGGEPSADLRSALKEGVINAVTAQEMGGLTRLKAFEEFQTRWERTKNAAKSRASAIISRPIAEATWFTGAAVNRLQGGNAPLFAGLGDFNSPELSALREAITRYAKFRADLEALRANARPHYAGAYWKDIDAMEDSAPGANDKALRQAAAISKATFGDYGDLTVLGTTLRDKFIPFYSWTEINFRYHANLFRNLRDMVRAHELSQAEAASAGARAAATFAAGFTARAAGGVMLRLALPYLAVYLWNNSGDRDDLEQLLSDEDRRRFHVILGEAPNGNVTLRDGRKVEVVYGNTAFMDVAKWFSGPKFVQAMAGWLNGKTDFPTAFSQWRDGVVPDFINNLVGSAGPYLKIPYTISSGKNPFPDVLDQRTVPAYDLRRVILGQVTDEFTADQIERTISKDYYGAKDLGTWAKQLILQVRARDPEAWAFYEIKDKAATFVEQRTGQKRDSAFDAPDQQVLRNFRRAIYRGDVDKAQQFYLRLLDYGYTAERFAASIRAQDPLAGLPKENGLRRQFVESLDEFDRGQLERAMTYYGRINGSRGREAQLFPRQASGARGLERYREAPRTEALAGMMQRAGSQDEEERLRQADKALRDSLRRK